MNKKLKLLFLLIALTIGKTTFAQTADPTLDETVEWIRSKLIAYGANVQDVKFDKSNYTLTIYYANYYKDGSGIESNDAIVQYISSLNTASFAWEAFKDNISLTVAATSGRNGSTKFHKDRFATDYKKDSDRAYFRVLFNTGSFGNEENLQERFTKAMKNLIKLCGGYVTNEKF